MIGSAWNVWTGGRKDDLRSEVEKGSRINCGWMDERLCCGCNSTSTNQRGRWFMFMKESRHYADAGATSTTLIGRGGHCGVCVQHPLRTGTNHLLPLPSVGFLTIFLSMFQFYKFNNFELQQGISISNPIHVKNDLIKFRCLQCSIH